MARTSSERITSTQAAIKIGISEGTLRNWRLARRGPPFHTLTRKTRLQGRGSKPRIFYLAHEVDAYVKGGSNGKGQTVRSRS